VLDRVRPVAKATAGRPAAAVLAALSGLALSTASGAACLTGSGSTGYEAGNQTISVTIINHSADTQIFGVTCEPNSGFVDPGQTQNGAGRAEFVADYSGYSLRSSISAGGQVTGSAGASALGSARWVVIIESLPGYAGPATVDIDFTAFIDISGSIAVSGPGSAGGTFSSEYSIKPADQQFGGEILVTGSGQLAGVSPDTIQVTTSVDVDREYVIQIDHIQNVTVSVGTSMGNYGSAASSGASRLSFGVEISPSFLDPLLSVYYPIQDLPGVDPPVPGGAPDFPSVPALPPAAIALLVAAFAGGGRTALARTPTRRPVGGQGEEAAFRLQARGS